jgi:hypothetical protein
VEEPSVLDYIKSRLMPWKYPPVEIPGELPDALRASSETAPALQPARPQAEPLPGETMPAQQAQPSTVPARWPWRSLTALFVALVAQYSLGPSPQRGWITGVTLLIVAIALLAWARRNREWPIAPLPAASTIVDPPTLRPASLLAGLVLALVAFLTFGGLRFNGFNTLLLLAALFFTARAFWIPSEDWRQALRRWSDRRPWMITISLPTLCSLAAIALVLFFRFYRLAGVPPEMNSDHAEKIVDILRVLRGEYHIFFSGNGGREALIFYLGAAVHNLLGLPLGFTALKWVSMLVGVSALPFLYLLGGEMGSKRIGLLAFILAGVAYWPNVVSRFGLRLPFYMLFTAAVLYFLLRGIRTGRRNPFIYAGSALGFSFYGYSADRILPLLVLVATGLYLIHHQSRGKRLFAWFSLLALGLVSLVIFLPLLRYILSEPTAFLFRTLTRMGTLERAMDSPGYLVFLSNMWRALAMFSWDSGEIWPTSIPHYPALGVVSGALFYLGAALLGMRYLRGRHWLDLFWLFSIPILQLPSTLSLAFPAENPNLYRTGGALIPVFLMAGIALDGLMRSMTKRIPAPAGKRYAWAIALLLIGLSCLQDYDLVFRQFYEQYRLSSWNTSEIGQVVREYTTTLGSPETVWVMGAPHWVDTRLVAINAGYPGKDFALFVDELGITTAEPRSKLFIVKPDDQPAIDALGALYPQGWFQTYISKAPTKDFLIFFVPPKE